MLLEYDDHRSGSFEALSWVPDDKMVILGLVSTKQPDLEPTDVLIERIGEASRFCGAERLGVSPQCGFATSVIGNVLTQEDQRGKLNRVIEVADAVW